MRLHSFVLILLSSGLVETGCGTRGSVSLNSPEVEKQAIIQTLRDWSDGYIKHDLAALDRVRAEDWTYAGDPSGALLTRQEGDRFFQTDTTRYLGWDYSDLGVRLYGPTAVATGRERIRSENAGRQDSASFRFTAVFVKQGSQWRCVASHSSPIEAGK